MDKTSEQLFTALKEDSNLLREEMKQGFEKQDELLNQIALATATTLEIVKSNDIRIKEMEARIGEHERRIFRLEKKPV